jgi:serine/threonine-protein kinase
MSSPLEAAEYAQSFSRIDEFLLLLFASGLLTFSELRDACAGFDVNRVDDTSLDDLCKYLIANEAITPWQLDKLRQGKWKGFWLDQYRLLGHIDKAECETTYLAEEWPSGRQVALVVTPPKVRKDGQPLYRVEECPR